MIQAATPRENDSKPMGAADTLPVARIAIWFCVTRIALWAVAGLSLWLIPRGTHDVHVNLAGWLDHWDANWYLSIAKNGYSYDPHAQSNAAFFPLYPVLARGLFAIVPNLLVAGYIVSAGFLFSACLLLWKLVVRDYGDRALADRAVLFLLVCPLTIFYSSFYTESLFFFLALSVAWFAGAGQWLRAGLGGFLASLTRPPGALLTVIIAFEYGVRIVRRRKDPAHPRVFILSEILSVLVALLLPPCALFAFGYYLYLKFGDSKIMFHVHDHWSQHLEPPWHIFVAALMYHAFYIIWFDAALVVAGVLAWLGVRYRLRPSHLAFLFTFLLLYSTNSLLEAFPRYLSVLFPFYIIAAGVCLRHPRFERWFVGASAALAILSTVLFVDEHWST